tara:strand:- start:84 stop:650 length:567 start_codon:yes stop_codon:yes gene_type:complete
MNNPERPLYWYFKNLYSSKEIKILNKKIKKNLLSLEDNPAIGVVKTAKVLMVNPQKIKELNRMFESLYDANRQNFGFNLFSSITDKYIPLNYNIYDAKVKGEYKYHADAAYQNPVLDIKLTGILNLSLESYTGGKFYLNPFGKEIVVPEFSESGDMVIFPAWFFHQVTPVTTGKRITLTIWAKGPKFI